MISALVWPPLVIELPRAFAMIILDDPSNVHHYGPRDVQTPQMPDFNVRFNAHGQSSSIGGTEKCRVISGLEVLASAE